MRVIVELTEPDIRAYAAFVQSKAYPSSTLLGKVALWFAIFLATALGSLVYRHVTGQAISLPLSVYSTVAALCLFLGLLAFYARRSARLPIGDHGYLVGSRTYELSDKGISETTEHTTTFSSWSGVQDFAETQTHFFVMLDLLSGYVFPKRAFPGEPEWQTFKSIVRARCLTRRCS